MILMTFFQRVKDRVLILGVAALVAMDLIILVTYTLVEGIKGNLGSQEVTHRGNPVLVQGVSCKN